MKIKSERFEIVHVSLVQNDFYKLKDVNFGSLQQSIDHSYPINFLNIESLASVLNLIFNFQFRLKH